MTQNLIKPYIDISKIQPFIKWVGEKRGLLSQIIPLLPKEFNNYKVNQKIKILLFWNN